MTATSAKFQLVTPPAAPTHVSWSESIAPKVTAIMVDVAQPLVKLPTVSQPSFSSTFVHAVSGQPPAPAVGQEIGGMTQGRGAAI